MKKRDIIKLVKETVAKRRKKFYGQHDYYGNNVGGRNSISGMPGVWEDKKSTSNKLKTQPFPVVGEESQGTLSSDMLNYADQYHMELVDTMKGVSTHPDKRTGGFYIKFPHENGPGPGALFGKETVLQIEKSKAAAKAAALKTYTKFQDQIEDYEISDSKSGVYGNIWLWVMPKDNIKQNIDMDKVFMHGQDQDAYRQDQNEMFGKKEPFTKDYGSKINPEDFKSKMPVGKTVLYGGTRYKVLENDGYILK